MVLSLARVDCGLVQGDRQATFADRVRSRVVLSARNCMGIVALARHFDLPRPDHLRFPDFLRVMLALAATPAGVEALEVYVRTSHSGEAAAAIGALAAVPVNPHHANTVAFLVAMGSYGSVFLRPLRTGDV